MSFLNKSLLTISFLALQVQSIVDIYRCVLVSNTHTFYNLRSICMCSKKLQVKFAMTLCFMFGFYVKHCEKIVTVKPYWVFFKVFSFFYAFKWTYLKLNLYLNRILPKKMNNIRNLDSILCYNNNNMNP